MNPDEITQEDELEARSQKITTCQMCQGQGQIGGCDCGRWADYDVQTAAQKKAQEYLDRIDACMETLAVRIAKEKALREQKADWHGVCDLGHVASELERIAEWWK